MPQPLDFILGALKESFKSSLSSGFIPSFMTSSLNLSLFMWRSLELALYLFNPVATFANKFLALLIVITFLLSSLYNISPISLWKFILTSRGTLVKTSETFKDLNCEPEGKGYANGCCSEKSI